MSEYWVSHKKYFCKYCNIYIADDAPSRRQHESGLRHKGNVERFVRGLYKAGEKRKQDLEEEKREMARVEKAAQAAYAQDVGAGLVKPGSSSTAAGPSTSSGPKTAAPKPSDPYANYTTAEFLGFKDPDEERRKAEAARRLQEGVAGEWEVVDVVPQPASSEQQQDGSDIKPDATSTAPRVGEKRSAEQPPDEEDARGWKLRRKVASVGLGELYDPGAIPIKLKAKKEEPEGNERSKDTTSSSGVVGPSGGLPLLSGTEKPKWSARGWNKPGTSSRSTVTPEPSTGSATEGDHHILEGSSHGVKTEEPVLPDGLFNEPVKTFSEDPPCATVKTEELQPSVKSELTETDDPQPPTSAGSLFKKRKVPVAGGNRGGRRL
ncbi:hypothetical protein C8Q73DRAFT_699464 [Cubamyces lactineus]|nr:hypothetical protein C8Q73DRAFT_699464 [Cubamyces lactineus]